MVLNTMARSYYAGGGEVKNVKPTLSQAAHFIINQTDVRIRLICLENNALVGGKNFFCKQLSSHNTRLGECPAHHRYPG